MHTTLKTDGLGSLVTYTPVPEPAWGAHKVVKFTLYGRRPRTLFEWARMVWNYDIFFGPVPFLKTAVLVLYGLEFVRWLW